MAIGRDVLAVVDDDAESSRRVVALALELAELRGVPLAVLAVVRPGSRRAPAGDLGPLAGTVTLDLTPGEHDVALLEAEARARELGVRYRSFLTMTADPAGAILTRADRLDASAIVLSGSRRGGRRLVQRLLGEARCPVALVPPP